MGEELEEAVGQTGDVMPPPWMERLIGWLLPAIVREHVLGDLRERYRNLNQYLIEALGVVPCVVWCRIRRTSDARVVLLEAFCLYVPLVVAAWVIDRELLMPERLGFVRLGGMALAGLVGMTLSDAYARPGKEIVRRALGGGVVGTVCQGLMHVAAAEFWPERALPNSIVVFGIAFGVLLVSGVRILFLGDESRPTGA